jgi:hypothetical protein
VEHHVSCWFEEQELEEGVKDLLDHLVVLLLGSKKVLNHLNQIRISNEIGNLLGTTDGGNEHNTLEHNIVFGEAVNQIVVDEFQEVSFFDNDFPVVGWDVDHGTQELKHEVSIVTTLLDK